MTPDFSTRLPGRGAWVAARAEDVAAAVKRNAFARAFKSPAVAPAELPASVEAGLARRALDAIGLARRTGDAVSGFEKVRGALREGKVGLLLTAREAGADGREKIVRLAKDIAHFDIFSSDELSRALGFDGAVHVAVRKGPAATRVLRETTRLLGFRKSDPQHE